MIATVKQWAVLAFAILCLIAGLATVWLPIPTGIPLLAFGTFLIIANSRTGRSWVRKARSHISWLDHGVLWLEERSYHSFSRVLMTTRPLLTRYRKRAETQCEERTGSNEDV